MLAAGICFLLIASFLHCWYSGHASASFAEKAAGFHTFGSKALGISIAMLIVGLALIWAAIGFLGAGIAAAGYFFLLPLLNLPLLRLLKAIPPAASTETNHMPLISAMERSYFEYKRRYPDKAEMAYLFLALRARYIEKPEDQIWGIVRRCANLDDAIVEAARVDVSDEAAEQIRSRLQAVPMCTSCGKFRALSSQDSLCYGCRNYGDS